MERIRFRSTSVVHLQAELHERDLLARTERKRGAPIGRPGRTVFGLDAAWRRIWRGDPR